MSSTDLAVLALAGLVAGAVNAVAGGGSLLTFPVLVALGLPALTANVTNTFAQLPGYAAVVVGYRRELVGQGHRLRRLAPPLVAGALAGVLLLRLSSEHAFAVIVPWLVLLAVALLALQPRLRALLEQRRPALAAGGDHWPPLLVVSLLCGAYAAYFGAAVGVVLLAALALCLSDTLQRLNALNRALVLIANLVSAPLLPLLLPIDWSAVAVLAPATTAGGFAGAALARRLPDAALRASVVALGLVAALWLLLR